MSYYLVTVEEYDNEGRGGQQIVCNCSMEISDSGKRVEFVKYVYEYEILTDNKGKSIIIKKEVKKPIEDLVCSSDVNSRDSFKIINFVAQKDYYK